MSSKFISNARRRRRRWPLVLLLLFVLAAGAGLGVYLIFFQKESNYSNPNAEFEGKKPQKKPKPKPKGPTFKWPIYGYTPDRARYLDAKLNPPLKREWLFHRSNQLIEFQPILANGYLYWVDNGATAHALNAKTGKPRWRHDLGSLNASAP